MHEQMEARKSLLVSTIIENCFINNLSSTCWTTHSEGFCSHHHHHHSHPFYSLLNYTFVYLLKGFLEFTYVPNLIYAWYFFEMGQWGKILNDKNLTISKNAERITSTVHSIADFYLNFSLYLWPSVPLGRVVCFFTLKSQTHLVELSFPDESFSLYLSYLMFFFFSISSPGRWILLQDAKTKARPLRPGKRS